MIVYVEFLVDFDFVECLGIKGVKCVNGDDLLKVVFFEWC